MSCGHRQQNFRGGPRMIAATAPIVGMGRAELRAWVTGTLRSTFGAEKHAAKRLALVADATPKAAENWLAGKCMPQGLSMLRLIALVPEFQAEARRLMAMEAELDPRFERQLQETFRLFELLPRRARGAAVQALLRDQRDDHGDGE